MHLASKMGQNFLLCVDVPGQCGGIGTPFMHSMVEVSRYGCSGFGSGLAAHSDIVAHYLVNSGPKEQRQGYLPGMVSGDLVGAIAMTEPGAEPDLQDIYGGTPGIMKELIARDVLK